MDAVHALGIALHGATKKYFDSLAIKKLPKVCDLKKEYVVLKSEKKKLYNSFKDLRAEIMALQMTKHNAEVILTGPRKST